MVLSISNIRNIPVSGPWPVFNMTWDDNRPIDLIWKILSKGTYRAVFPLPIGILGSSSVQFLVFLLKRPSDDLPYKTLCTVKPLQTIHRP
ncbi:hypothetical protein CJ263_13580 [Maribacter cobaltidurans]|uniref:Uncharacterized protein n=1 Tax=Maribacter cobaltidurans TaxID=1178778 RepID=A0A223V8F0_9FLAO|nr:hypothetical protein CJ263_13580 [Maribacter cobaltidurans]